MHIDITERKLREIEREQMARQERLSAVGQMAAGIAHDFNNILSTISIYAETMRDAPGLPVEDDDAVRGSLAALLQEWNYQVVEAANSQDALAWLDKPEPVATGERAGGGERVRG